MLLKLHQEWENLVSMSGANTSAAAIISTTTTAAATALPIPSAPMITTAPLTILQPPLTQVPTDALTALTTAIYGLQQ
jgi:hypothetical protein